MVEVARDLRVAFILGRDGQGGSESQARLLVRGLTAAGVPVDVFLVEGDGKSSDFGGAEVISLGGRRRPGLPGLLQMFVALIRLVRHLRRGRYTVAHAVMARAYVLMPLAVTLAPGVATVAWRRNLGIHTKPHSPAAALEFLASRLTDMVICNSTVVRDYWVAQRHVRPDRCVVIPNALENWRFEPIIAAPRSDRRRLVAVGGLKKVKGHEALVRACKALEGMGWQAEVVILGEGECRDDLVSLADTIGVNLALAGHVSDPRPWLSSADVFVHPSHSEGLSNAILEAMAQRVPVVCTDVGGARELLGEAGVLVQPGAPGELSVAIARVLDMSRAEVELMTNRAGEHAMNSFSLDAVVEQHLAVYAGLGIACKGSSGTASSEPGDRCDEQVP